MQENSTSSIHDGIDFDIQKLIINFLYHWWLIVLCAVVGAVVSFLVASQLMTPTYRASVSIYVNNIAANQQVEYITSSNLSTSARLVSTYTNIITSDTVLEKVSASMDGLLSASQIRGMISAQQRDETEMFDLYVTGTDPELIALVANTVAEVAPNEIESFVEGSSTKIIDYAKVPTAPFSPDVKKITLIGTSAGVCIALLFLTIRFVLDVRIKTADDLEALFAFPVLGQIPVFGQSNSTGKYKYHSHYYKSEYKSDYTYAASAPKEPTEPEKDTYEEESAQLLAKADALTGKSSGQSSDKPSNQTAGKNAGQSSKK